MFRALTIAGRLVLGSIVVGLAAFLPASLPGTSTPSAFADATFTVKSTDDTPDAAPGDGICEDGPYFDGPGRCTLRAAIEESNASPGDDTIAFEIRSACIDFNASTICQPGGEPESRVRTISPTSPLPAITDPVAIDGTTQPGFSGKPLIELDGWLAGRTATGLDLRAGHSIVKGLVINRFQAGITLWSGDNTIQGNFIGTDTSGTIARGNSYVGVNVPGAIGYTPLFGNVIGGTTAADRNLISGNYWGVIAWGGVRLLGNYIGTDHSGTKPLGNVSGVLAGTNPNSGVFAAGVAIGGPGSGEGNLISGNSGPGISVEGGTNVVGNKIGTTAHGKKPLGNAGAGIADVSGYGFVDARDNVVAYNGSYGIDAMGGAGFLVRNSIYSNGAEGLAMYSDPDYPTSSVIQLASRSRDQLDISGSAHSIPEAVLEIEVFANEACDPSGFGEGELPLGTVRVAADGDGDASFNVTVDAPTQRFRYVTATVTTIVGGGPGYTSNFSNCLPVSRQ